MHEQTIWLAPRATSFVEACEHCEEDGLAGAEVRGSLAADEGRGWARCPSGHAVRVLRMTAAMPAGAFR